MPEVQRNDMVQSYHRVRTAIGLLGIGLPLALILGGLLDRQHLEPSISDFYHTTYRDIFVGTLCAIGVFLICYRGYARRSDDMIGDDWLGTIAGLAAFGVALFPNESPTAQIATMTQELVGIGISPLFHYGAALIFFSCLAVFCLKKFARTAKPARKRIYRFCGWVIVASLLGITLASLVKLFGSGAPQEMVIRSKLVFWCEAIGIWAFGLSWLVKGKADIALVQLARQSTQKASGDA